MAKLRRYKRIGLVGLPCAAAALVPLALVPAQLDVVAVGALLFVTGCGIGTVFVAPESSRSTQCCQWWGFLCW